MIVGKKDRIGKGIDRIYINFAFFNEIIEKNNNPISIIKKYLSLFYEVKWLTILDLALIYWQIFLTKRSWKYIVFLIAYIFY